MNCEPKLPNLEYKKGDYYVTGHNQKALKSNIPDISDKLQFG